MILFVFVIFINSIMNIETIKKYVPQNSNVQQKKLWQSQVK